jgi:hypothetical protein
MGAAHHGGGREGAVLRNGRDRTRLPACPLASRAAELRGPCLMVLRRVRQASLAMTRNPICHSEEGVKQRIKSRVLDPVHKRDSEKRNRYRGRLQERSQQVRGGEEIRPPARTLRRTCSSEMTVCLMRQHERPVSDIACLAFFIWSGTLACRTSAQQQARNQNYRRWTDLIVPQCGATCHSIFPADKGYLRLGFWISWLFMNTLS